MNMGNLTEQQIEDNREFLVGDVVVSKLEGIIPELFRVSEQPHQSYEEYIMCKPLNHEYKCWLAINEIRHATVAEHNANRRLPDPDDVDDIEYHISPNCKVIRFDCWDEALHFHRAFHAQKEIP